MTDQPAIVQDLPFADYRDWPGVHQSLLKVGLPPHGTMAHIKDRLDHPVTASRWMRIGSLIHAGQFDPGRMLDGYVVQPAFELDPENVTGSGQPSTSKATSYYKGQAAQFAAINEDRQIIDATEYDAIRAMIHNLDRYERARGYFAQGDPEVSIRAPHDDTGMMLVGRIDWLNHEQRYFVDLKTTNNITRPDRFLADSKTDFQLAFYRRLLMLTTGEEYHARLVLVGNQRPFLVDAGRVADESLDQMDDLIDPLLANYRRCLDSGEWPGLDDTGDKLYTVGSYHLPDQEPLRLTSGGQPLTAKPKPTDRADADEIIMF